MSRVTIIGSGPAAAAAAVALVRDGRTQVQVLDIGQRLESDRAELLESLADVLPWDWPPEDRRKLSSQPVSRGRGELPEKRIFGSDFPFRDAGQLDGLTAEPGANGRSTSGAFGGFSNAWGAQVMPFSRPTLDAWPVGYEAMLPHYREILRLIPFSGADDDYSDLFPLLGDAEPLPPLAPPAAATLQRYGRRRGAIRARGVTLGAARLAFEAKRCVECGLCLTGCPYRLIYDSTQTLAPLVERGTVNFRDGLLVIAVGEDPGGCWVKTKDLRTGDGEIIRSDRILLACGGLGTTRLALNSLSRDVHSVKMRESVQFVLPLVTGRAYPDPHTYSTFTLNQFNMLVEYGRPGLDLAQIHLYPYNPAFEDALPGPIARSGSAGAAILRRVVAGLGYLPSWASPDLELAVGEPAHDHLPDAHLKAGGKGPARTALAHVMAKVLAVAPALDLWPFLPSLRLSGAGKSYHFGGSLPHVAGEPRPDRLETDELGRPAEWDRIHLIDGSVFPSVAATTFTLTVMANAHRIASRVAELSS